MGFKRTPEGRVFFQGGEMPGANDEMLKPRPQQGLGLQSDTTQAQIITLLKTLNERLKLTQADRQRMEKELEAYRALVEDLETKTAQSARAFSALEKKVAQAPKPQENLKAEALAKEALAELERTRKLLLDLEDKTARADQSVASIKNELQETRQAKTQLLSKQAALEKMSREQAEKLGASAESYKDMLARLLASEEKQEALGLRMEQASLEQERLVRKMDKAIEDRARFMRKIERIEETVLQTRDALNAKAMVLLTDQNNAPAAQVTMADFAESEEAGLAALRASQAAQAQKAAFEPEQWWRKPYRLQAASVAVLVIASVVGGWAISQSQMPRLPDFSQLDLTSSAPETDVTAQDSAAETDDAAAQRLAQITPEAAAPLSMAATDWSVNTDTSAFAEAPEALAGENTGETAEESAAPEALTATNGLEADDIGAAAIDDTAAVERLLSGTATEEDLANPDELAAALNALEPSKLTAQSAPAAQEIAIDSALESRISDAPAQNPSELIQPDSALPDVVKKIEDQAFAGVPEAQHDLAAIYTAGHGGVAQNYDRAAFWFEQSARGGVANAAYNLGVLYHQGLGRAADIDTALAWYAKAAAMGHPEAQYNLGIAHIEGIGVSYDPQRAAQYFQNAADQGVMEAAYNLGLIYENGLLGAPKPDEALMWYKIASDSGSPEAKQALEQLAKALNIDLKDVNKLAESMKAIKKTDAGSSADAPAVKKKTSALTDTPVAPAEKHSSALQATPAQPAQLDVKTAALSSAQAITAQVQDYLMLMGLYPGPADGLSGPQTIDAVRAYQKQNGLSDDGQVSKDLLAHMENNAINYDENTLR